MLPLLREEAGRHVEKDDIVEFNIPRALGLAIRNRELFQKVAKRGLYWSARRPIPLAAACIKQLSARGHKVTIITSRPKLVAVSGDENPIEILTETTNWVQTHLGDLVRVDLRGGDPDDPVEKVVDEDGFDLFVDDDPATLFRIDTQRRHLRSVKTQCIAFDQPWNQSWPGNRVTDWRQIVELAGNRRHINWSRLQYF
jgi:hypothetical protein